MRLPELGGIVRGVFRSMAANGGSILRQAVSFEKAFATSSVERSTPAGSLTMIG